MLRQAISRVRAHSILLPVASTLPQCSFSLDIEAAKARVTHWEPTLQFPSNPHQETEEIEDTADNISWMTTYSAFDPGMIRPLLMSGLACDIHESSYPGMMYPPLMSGLSLTKYESASREKQFVPAAKQPTDVVKPNETSLAKSQKPWPYLLPTFLRPQAGTTFATVHGDTAETQTPRRVRSLWAVLYGLPEPEKFSITVDIVSSKGMLYKVFYGVKSVEGEAKRIEATTVVAK